MRMSSRGCARLAAHFILIVTGLSPARADNQTSFIVNVTHAYYSAVMCPGVSVTYDGFVTSAKLKQLKPELVEEVRNGVMFLNTNGQNGQKPPKETMDRVILASKMVALDVQKGSVEGWCKHRQPSLIKAGFI